MSRSKATWTGSVDEPVWGSSEGDGHVLYVTLDNEPDRRVEIRISPNVMHC